MSGSQYSFHADRYGSKLFASLWAEVWGEQYPVEVAPFSSCTYQLLQQLTQQLRLKPGDVLVDLGCGTGGVGLWLAQEHKAKLIGVDRCSDATAIATKRASEWGLVKQPSFVTGDFCKTGIASSSVDAIFSIDAFPAAQNIESALSEARRILKPNGVFVFTAAELGPNSRHFEKMGPDWSTGLERNGFDVTNIQSRSNVSELWRSLYTQWLKQESALRKELQPETVDALIAEARRGLPSMTNNKTWYLITATARA